MWLLLKLLWLLLELLGLLLELLWLELLRLLLELLWLLLKLLWLLLELLLLLLRQLLLKASRLLEKLLLELLLLWQPPGLVLEGGWLPGLQRVDRLPAPLLLLSCILRVSCYTSEQVGSG